MNTNPYSLLIAMKLDGDYISQESAISFAMEYARLESERLKKPIEISEMAQKEWIHNCKSAGPDCGCGDICCFYPKQET